MNENSIKSVILSEAKNLGFDLVAVTDPTIPDTGFYHDWLDNKYNAAMEYMHKNMEKRLNPQLLVPEVKTILCVGLNYYQNIPNEKNISLYAWGKDYHIVIKEMLHKLAEKIQELTNISYRAFVDSGPVLEKVLAAKAGLGWIGKNACLINRNFGSFIFLAELFLDIELPPDNPAKNHCGTCQKCIQACPTQAIVAPGVIDARKCISYLTIEHKGEINPELSDKMCSQLFGCDICQQVCPFNNKSKPTSNPDFKNHILGPYINPKEIQTWDEKAYKTRTANSAGSRATLNQWQRNAGITSLSTTNAWDQILSDARSRPNLDKAQADALAEHEAGFTSEIDPNEM